MKKKSLKKFAQKAITQVEKKKIKGGIVIEDFGDV